jgi:hypothetical protein
MEILTSLYDGFFPAPFQGQTGEKGMVGGEQGIETGMEGAS